MPALALAQQTLGCGSSQDAMELVRAVRHALNEDPDLDSEALFAREDVRKHIVAKPKRGSSKRKTTPAAERRGEYDSEKCDARIWMAVPGVKNTGYSDIQCSSRKAGDGCFCKKHANQESQGLLWCGRITEDPPENPVKVEGNGNQKEMFWYKDEDGESSPKPKTKGAKPKKQSPPWKPAGANTEPSLEEQLKAAKEKEKKSRGRPKKTPPKEENEEKKPRGRPKKSPPNEENEEKPKEKKPRGRPKKSPAKEKVEKVDKELGDMDPSEMSMGQLQALMAAKKMMESVKDKEEEELEEDTEDMSDDEDGLEEIDYEGIGYLMNGDMVVIEPESMEEVGKWDPDEEEIEWIDDEMAEEHAEKVANL